MTFALDLYQDVAAFETAARAFLEAREAENALLLGLLARRALPARPFMALATFDAQPVFAAFLSDHNLVLAGGPDEALAATRDALIAHGAEVPGVIGPSREATFLTEAWARHRGLGVPAVTEQRIYALTTVTWPSAIPGRMRPLGDADLEQAAQWSYQFDRESLPAGEWRTLEGSRAWMAGRIGAGDLFGWEHEAKLVAMAGLTRPTTHTISVNSVYTPRAQRGRGFATSLVAAVSAAGLARGKTSCVLYTDLANPTSNAIYRRIGYRAIGDSRHYHF